MLIGGEGVREGLGHVGVEETVEEMLAGFAADGEASCDVGAGSKAALDGVADGHIFFLDFFTDGDAFPMRLRGGGADVGEVIVENDGAFIHAERKD